MLNCEIEERYDICFSMAIAIIMVDEEPRFQTFQASTRLLGPGSLLVLVTGSNQ